MRWKLAENVLLTEVPGDAASGEPASAVLLHLGTRHYFTLNGTGLFIVRHIEQGLDAEAIAGALTRSYAVETERATQAVTRLTGELLHDRLIETA